MSRWPPAVWLMVAVGSLLILIGYDGAEFNPQAFIPGVCLIVAAAGLALYLALGRWSRRPMPRGVAWLIPATLLFYLVCAAAAMVAGGAYAVAAIVAGMIPLTAATLIVATARAKSGSTAGDNRDPFPGIGADDSTPLGDTPEHSDAERVGTPGRPHGRRR